MKSREIEPIVTKLLEQHPATRKDDFMLVLGVYWSVNKNAMNMRFVDVMKDHEKMGLPSFESITRCRRKICESRPELKDKKMAVIREEEQQEFKKYSRE